ncbi:MAG: hypothetical protein HY707_00740, partial [Ignavibacteriae bacterium]|nr:hypothetical protein [Ignavibacteriota bacterium]
MGGKAALILVLGFGFIFGYIGIRLNGLESRSVDNSSKYLEVTVAHNLAVAGANVGLAKLYQDTSLWRWNRSDDTVLTKQKFTSGQFSGGSLTVRFGYNAGNSLRLKSFSSLRSGTRTLHDTVIVVLNRYNYWELWGFLLSEACGQFHWISGDTTWGRVHDNGDSPVQGSPVFNNKITVSGAFRPSPGVSPNFAIFKDGYETGTPKVPIPTAADINVTQAKTDTQLTGSFSFELVDSTISLRPVGFIKIRSGLNNFTSSPILYYFYNYDPLDSITLAGLYSPKRFAENKVIWVSNSLSIRGVVSGQATIGAQQDIYPVGNITYARDPRVTTSDDMLGLIARQDFILDNDPFIQNEFYLQSLNLAERFLADY